MYNLIHCSGHIKGFELFKKTAWQIFGGSSSNKDTHGQERQGVFDFYTEDSIDEDCYHIDDIACYIHSKFRGRKDVPFVELWAVLKMHPVFPSEDFSKKIMAVLERKYKAKKSRKTITFSNMEINS